MQIDIQLLIYFLTTTGALIAISWRGGNRLGAIETSIEWLTKRADELKIDLDNVRTRAFQNKSPVSLTEYGMVLLKDSGIKDYIDDNLPALLDKCKSQNLRTAYDVQDFVFEIFDKIQFEEDLENKIKGFAYNQGVSLEIIKRVGGIYFRDLAIRECGFDVKDLG